MPTEQQLSRARIRRTASKEQRKAGVLQRHRRKLSFITGSQALRQAFSEATAPQRTQLRAGGFTTRPLLVEDPKGTAFADPGRVRAGFATTGGKLNVPQPVGTARHEVSHLLGAGHLAMRATLRAPIHAGLPGTPRSVQTSVRTSKMPIGRQQHRATVLDVRRSRGASPPSLRTFEPKTPITRTLPGVNPGSMRGKFRAFGQEDSKRGKRLRRQSFNLSLKLRKAGRDF